MMASIQNAERKKMGWIWVVFSIYAIVSASGLLLIKIGTSDSGISIQNGLFSLQASPQIIIGLVLYICSFVISIYVISRMNLSLFYPVGTGTILVLTFIMSVFILKEHISVYQIIGAALIIGGIVFMNIRTE